MIDFEAIDLHVVTNKTEIDVFFPKKGDVNADTRGCEEENLSE